MKPDGIELIEGLRPDPAVEGMLERNERTQRPEPSLLNLSTILSEDDRQRDRLQYNEFECTVYLDGEPITDTAETGLNLWIQAVYGVKAPTKAVVEVMQHRAHQRRYHPVCDYLDGLVWDGVERIGGFLHNYCKAANSPLNRALSRAFLISAVARVMGRGARGVKVDTVLILQGRQGCGKSTVIKLLAGAEAFSDAPLDMTSKDGKIGLQGVWLYELGELESFSGYKWTKIKAFLSVETDKYRALWGRNDNRYHRQCVFVGTTNEGQFLSDPTGARRFWPVNVGQGADVDLDGVARDRDQIWAEAVHCYRQKEPWHLGREWAAELAEVHEEFHVMDPWEERIRDWLSEKEVRATHRLTTGLVLSEIIGRPIEKQTREDATKVGAILHRIGYSKSRPRAPKGQPRPFVYTLPAGALESVGGEG